jgi:UDP-glucuronate decarboxylase
MTSKKLAISEREFTSWLELRNESIFITGGSGFFGLTMLYSLLDSYKKVDLNIRVTVLTRNVNSFKVKHPILAQSSFIKLIEGDILNFDFPSEKFSRIFHLATTSASETFKGEDQLQKYKTLVDGTERLLKFAVSINIKKILFTSSGVAYGKLPKNMHNVEEKYSGGPDTSISSSALAQGKRSAEFLIAYYADKYNFDFVIARCFSFIGPYLPLQLHYAIGNFVYDALFNEKIQIKGDGKAIRSYLDVNDLTVWLLKLMSTDCSEKIYNVGSDKPISVLNLAEKIRDLISPDKEILILGDISHSVGNFSRNYYVPNIDRAKRELKLDVWIDIESSIQRVFEANRHDA